MVEHNGNLYRVLEDQSDNSKEAQIYLSGFHHSVKFNECKTFTKITKTARRYTTKAVKDFLYGDCDLGYDEQIVTLELNNHRTLSICNDYDNCSGVQLISTAREYEKIMRTIFFSSMVLIQTTLVLCFLLFSWLCMSMNKHRCPNNRR